MDYRDLYFYLFSKITDAIIEIGNGNFIEAEDILMKAQQECQERSKKYIRIT